MSNQVEHSDFLCLLLIIYFIIRISFFNYLAKILLGQPLWFCMILDGTPSKFGDGEGVFLFS
jgi:hypothetical protein